MWRRPGPVRAGAGRGARPENASGFPGIPRDSPDSGVPPGICAIRRGRARPARVGARPGCFIRAAGSPRPVRPSVCAETRSDQFSERRKPIGCARGRRETIRRPARPGPIGSGPVGPAGSGACGVSRSASPPALRGPPTGRRERSRGAAEAVRSDAGFPASNLSGVESATSDPECRPLTPRRHTAGPARRLRVAAGAAGGAVAGFGGGSGPGAEVNPTSAGRTCGHRRPQISSGLSQAFKMASGKSIGRPLPGHGTGGRRHIVFRCDQHDNAGRR
jgi:hypothetical protein